jgi:dipeptide/tripeptide permease
MNEAMELYHAFNMMCYFFPLVGAAISDSFLNKFWTISILSVVYVIGTILLSISSVPDWFGAPPNIPRWPSLIGLLLIAIGTGGIKPCVSALGGDQFLPEQKHGLNTFYNYFYMAINIGAILAGISPLIQERNFYGNDGDGYPVVFGMCAGVLALATLLLIIGKSFYRIVPPAGIFLPGKIAKTGASYVYHLVKFGGDSSLTKEVVEEKYGKELVTEYLEMVRVIGVLLPAPFFWYLSFC